MDIQFVIQLIVMLLPIGVVYGILKNKVDALGESRRECIRRFERIEVEHDATISDIRTEIRLMSASLNQLIGMINTIFKQETVERGH